jgi:energy-coupling factor transporter ATP-binding protein EcfA2
MLRAGLTGNIGSGKSTVSRIFSTLGVPASLRSYVRLLPCSDLPSLRNPGL